MAQNQIVETLNRVDRGVQQVLRVICGILILLTVLFTIYTVFMRYVIEDPPFWGDTVALFANIWLVLLALGLAVRGRGQIAMTAVYEMGPPLLSFVLEIIWNLFIIAFGIFLAIFGWMTAMAQTGMFWELDNMSKTYPMMIMPLTGVLVTLAAAAVIVEDVNILRSKDYRSYTEYRGT